MDAPARPRQHRPRVEAPLQPHYLRCTHLLHPMQPAGRPLFQQRCTGVLASGSWLDCIRKD